MAAAEPDYYELLGVSKGATLQEIRAEFRILETRWCKRRLYGKSGNSRRSLQNTSEYWMRVFDVFDSLFALRLHFQKAKSLHAASLESWFVNVCDRVQWCAMMCNDVQWYILAWLQICYVTLEVKKSWQSTRTRAVIPRSSNCWTRLGLSRFVQSKSVELKSCSFHVHFMFISCSFHVLYDVYMFLSSWSFWNSVLASHKNEETLLTRSSSAWNLKMAFESLIWTF